MVTPNIYTIYCLVHGISAEKLNWHLTVHDGYYPVSYHRLLNRVHCTCLTIDSPRNDLLIKIQQMADHTKVYCNVENEARRSVVHNLFRPWATNRSFKPFRGQTGITTQVK